MRVKRISTEYFNQFKSQEFDTVVVFIFSSRIQVKITKPCLFFNINLFNFIDLFSFIQFNKYYITK